MDKNGHASQQSYTSLEFLAYPLSRYCSLHKESRMIDYQGIIGQAHINPKNLL